MTYDGTASVLFIEVMKKRASARSYGLYTDYVLTKVGIVPIVGSVLPMELRDEARIGEWRVARPLTRLTDRCTAGTGNYVNVFARSEWTCGMQTVLKDRWAGLGNRPLFAWHEVEPRVPELGVRAHFAAMVWSYQLNLRTWWLENEVGLRRIMGQPSPEFGLVVEVIPDGNSYALMRVEELRLPWVAAGLEGAGPTATVSKDTGKWV